MKLEKYLVLFIVCLLGLSEAQTGQVQTVEGWISQDTSIRALPENFETLNIKNPTAHKVYLDSVFFSPEFYLSQWAYSHAITIQGQEYKTKMLEKEGEIPKGVYTAYGYVFELEPILIQPDETITIDYFESSLLIPAGWNGPPPDGTLLLVFRKGDLIKNLNTDKFFIEKLYFHTKYAPGINVNYFSPLGKRERSKRHHVVRFKE